MRLDLYLVENQKDMSRSLGEKLIVAGEVLVNGKVMTKKSYEVSEGDSVTIQKSDHSSNIEQSEGEKEQNISDTHFQNWILFENPEFIVINKPRGIAVHRGAGIHQDTKTVADMAYAYCKGNISSHGGKERPGIVHRLDKDTTGILIIAKTDRFHAYLSQEIASRRVQKYYRAIVFGHPKDGDISAPIKKYGKRQQVSIHRQGKTALTRFQVIHFLQKYDISLVDIELFTGRTHQIRIHFSAIGHPIVGDPLYGGSLTHKKCREIFHIGSQLLHAHRYSFVDPDGTKHVFTAPMPELYFKEEGFVKL